MSTPAPSEWPEVEARTAQTAQIRRGQHRDHALASYRRTRAVELRTTGMSYEQIAKEVGYANRGTAYKAVSQALQVREADSVALLRHLEFDRLEALVQSLWSQAMNGDLPSIIAVTKVVVAECRLLGLGRQHPSNNNRGSGARWDNCQGPTTVVVRTDDCRHGGCARHGRFESPE